MAVGTDIVTKFASAKVKVAEFTFTNHGNDYEVIIYQTKGGFEAEVTNIKSGKIGVALPLLTKKLGGRISAIDFLKTNF